MGYRSRRPIAGVVCAAMLAAIAMASSAPATAAKGEAVPQPTLSDERAGGIDAAAIALMVGITPEEAEAIIVRQAAIGEVIPDLEALLGSANAGISVDVPEESTVLNVRVAGRLPDATVAELSKVGATLRPHGVELALTQGLEHSLEELTAAAESLDAGRDAPGEILGVGVDVTHNEIFALVTRPGTAGETTAVEAGIPGRTAASTPIRVSERLASTTSVLTSPTLP